MKNQILKFLRDEEGLTIVEYAVAGGLITLAVVAAFTALGGAVDLKINELATTVSSAGTPAAAP